MPRVRSLVREDWPRAELPLLRRIAGARCRARILKAFAKAEALGIADPVVVVADPRDVVGRHFVEPARKLPDTVVRLASAAELRPVLERVGTPSDLGVFDVMRQGQLLVVCALYDGVSIAFAGMNTIRGKERFVLAPRPPANDALVATIALAAAALRGLLPMDQGTRFAVRSRRCAVCKEWEAALLALDMLPPHFIAPDADTRPAPVEMPYGSSCETCMEDFALCMEVATRRGGELVPWEFAKGVSPREAIEQALALRARRSSGMAN